MPETRCERCELIVGAGCACPANGSAPRVARGVATVRAHWVGWPQNSIIVSPAGNAHLPGCGHLEDSEIAAPKFGWVQDPVPGAWGRISEGNPLQATKGNADRVAVRRCESCDAGY